MTKFDSHPSSLTLRMAAVLSVLCFLAVTVSAFVVVKSEGPAPLNPQAQAGMQAFARLLSVAEAASMKGDLVAMEAAVAQIQAQRPLLTEIARAEPRLAPGLPPLNARADQIGQRRVELLRETWGEAVHQMSSLGKVLAVDYAPRNAAELRANLDELAGREDLWRRIAAAAWRFRATKAGNKIIISQDYTLVGPATETLTLSTAQMEELARLYPEAVAMLQ